ncbi:MAG: hypothetical protein R3324_04845 [Halobacteriales archaeon]|nr:hypothetical protein [Halobacteriales archaeon]
MSTMDLEHAGRTASEAAREAIACLARSWNRLHVLEALAVERRTRADLTALTEGSRLTRRRDLAEREPRDPGEEG